ERQWTRAYYDLVGNATGALLFVHPEYVVAGTRIDSADQLVGQLDEDGVSQGTAPLSEPWTPGLAPTQVQLVDLLQFIQQHPSPAHPFRVAVVVSAWDLVRAQGQEPDAWLEKHLPLLWQYLKANDGIVTTTFGISAQGGSLVDGQGNTDSQLRDQ